MGERSIDVAILAKILRALAEREMNIRELTKTARISFSTARFYVQFLAERDFVKIEERGREKVVKITEKGLQLLLDIQRVYARLGIEL